MLTLKVPKEIEDRLDALSKETGRSKTEHALEALAEYIGDHEDVALAEQRLLDLQAGRSTTVSLDDLMKRHGLAD